MQALLTRGLPTAILLATIMTSGCDLLLSNQMTADELSGRVRPPTHQELLDRKKGVTRTVSETKPDPDSYMARMFPQSTPGGANTERPKFHPSPLYRFKNDRAIACTSQNALLAITQPEAKATLGELNYMKIASQGDCVELDNHRAIFVCARSAKVTFVAQYFAPGAISFCSYIRTEDLGPQIGMTSEQ